MKKHELLLAGILSLIGGLLAWFNPFAATLAIEQLTGWCFLLAALTILYAARHEPPGQLRRVTCLIGITYLLLGIYLIARPLQGMIALTVLCALLLLLAGLFRLTLAFRYLAGNPRWVMAVSGTISLLLALCIISGFPATAGFTLGIFLAIELLTNGVALIIWSWQRG
ncbi:DUF308 domain-containing protein [uncultured Cardiobacterium sp.]|uniref:HdeD family acid-resistance protein n=1 Tax=uncultured Cardiobacterium sp. TaxID=417619 RepID=UPI00260F03BD|nr:DUF308 domain-containing protein [uncultured Cardiobacterium sp.]